MYVCQILRNRMVKQIIRIRPVVPGGTIAPPDFGRSVNHISTMGGRLCPPNNPQKSMECPICNKVLYDRSTWNRHMRIHTGEKPYPCRFCGWHFRNNYNKLGHEKRCPDRRSRLIDQPQPHPATGGCQENVVFRILG